MDSCLRWGPKVAHTLAVLVARCDEVVSKQELAREVWRDTVVEDNSLARGTLWYYNKDPRRNRAGTCIASAQNCGSVSR